MEKYQEVERSIIKTYRKDIWHMFAKAVNDYELIKENDKIMVCISGGKDSFLLAKCIEELQKHGKIHFDVCYVTMNPGYNEENKQKIIETLEKELKKDRTKTQIVGFSKLNLLEMTRKHICGN